MLELKTGRDEGKIYAWVQHTDLHPVTQDLIGGPKSSDMRKFLGSYRKELKQDTSRPGHNDDGLSPLKVLKLASHITVVKIFDSVESHIEGLPALSSAIAVCSKKDQFSRKKGLETALRRALGKAGYILVGGREVVEQ